MPNDDDFGPVQRGGGFSPRGVDVNPKPRPRSRPDAYAEHGPSENEGFAPPLKGRKSRVPVVRQRRRPLRIILLVLLVLILAAIATGVAAALSANNQIERVNVKGLEPSGSGQRNILLVGSDGREDMTAKQRRKLGTGNFDGTRTDTILLLSIEGSRGAMLSFPRDLYVPRCDGTPGRINAAYGIGGASCLVRTVNGISDIPITNYMEVDFLGFHDIVQAVGGVRMCLKDPISDRDAHIDLPKGCQRLNGKESLGYVRVRKIDNDLGRIERQQRFMKELAAEIAQPSTVFNPLRLFSTGNAVGSALTADKGTGVTDLAALARAGAALSKTKFPQFAVPATNTSVGGAAVLDITESEAEPLFQSFRDGSVLDQASSGGAVTPEDVSLEVHNGAGTPGLAGAVAEELTTRGFEVTDVGNADTVDTTVVQYRKGRKAHAELVAQQSPTGSAQTEQVDSGPPVVLILGRDAAAAAKANSGG